jgi:hypothetical protein
MRRSHKPGRSSRLRCSRGSDCFPRASQQIPADTSRYWDALIDIIGYQAPKSTGTKATGKCNGGFQVAVCSQGQEEEKPGRQGGRASRLSFSLHLLTLDSTQANDQSPTNNTNPQFQVEVINMPRARYFTTTPASIFRNRLRKKRIWHSRTKV